MARRDNRQAGTLGDLQQLSAIMEANKEKLPDLAPFRLRLTDIVIQSVEVHGQQAAFRAAKQESSKQLRRLLTEGKAVANLIRTAVKVQFGPSAEKIAEFGLQPFRGRKVKTAAQKPTPPDVSPASAGSAEPAE